MSCNYILGSGLIAFICKKILGDKWTIIPIAPSRFYSRGVPALGDDYVIHDDAILEIIKDWGLNTSPIFFRRPFSSAGSLLYNNMFANEYFNKIGLESNDQIKNYYKTDFTVYSFSCLQLWNMLVHEYITEVKEFYSKHNTAKAIKSVADHQIILDNNICLEYEQLISTVPSYVLYELLGHQDPNEYKDMYYYFIADDKIDLENADQVLICDLNIPFHKCTKIRKGHYLFEVIDKYFDNVYELFGPVIGTGFEIKDAKIVNKAHVLLGKIDEQIIQDNGIICIGSYAQCDPLMDVGSCIKRIYNLVGKQKI